jgi:hypothetical protein
MNRARVLKVGGITLGVVVIFLIGAWFGADVLVQKSLKDSGLEWRSIDRSGLDWELTDVTHASFAAARGTIHLGTTSRAEFTSMDIDLRALARDGGVDGALGNIPEGLYVSADPLKLRWGDVTVASGLRTRVDRGTVGARGPTMWIRGSIGATSELTLTGDLNVGGILATGEVEWTLGEKSQVTGTFKRVRITEPALTAKPIVLDDLALKISGTLDQASGTLSTARAVANVSLACDRANELACTAQAKLENTPFSELLGQLSEATPRLPKYAARGAVGAQLSIDFAASHATLHTDVGKLRTTKTGIDFKRYEAYFAFEGRDAKGKRIRLDSGPDSADWVEREDLPEFLYHAFETVLGLERQRSIDVKTPELGGTLTVTRAGHAQSAPPALCESFARAFLVRDTGPELTESLTALLTGSAAAYGLGRDKCADLMVNTAQFGPGIYGVGPAASHFFDAQAGDLTLTQAAFLAILLPDPERGYKRWFEKRASTTKPIAFILDAMLENKLISTSDAQDAKADTPDLD